MTGTVECIDRLQAVADQLIAEGAEPIFVVSAMAEVVARIAPLDPEGGPIVLEGLAAVASATAQAMRGRKVMEGVADALQT